MPHKITNPMSKCLHCKRHKGEHQAKTLSCPVGRKTRVGHLFFHPHDVFEAPQPKDLFSPSAMKATQDFRELCANCERPFGTHSAYRDACQLPPGSKELRLGERFSTTARFKPMAKRSQRVEGERVDGYVGRRLDGVEGWDFCLKEWEGARIPATLIIHKIKS